MNGTAWNSVEALRSPSVMAAAAGTERTAPAVYPR